MKSSAGQPVIMPRYRATTKRERDCKPKSLMPAERKKEREKGYGVRERRDKRHEISRVSEGQRKREGVGV